MNQPSRRPFGTTRSGAPVELLTLDNGTISCQVITFGATLRALTVPDREGRPVDVVLGYDNLSDYETRDGYLGAVVGRYANRIAKGRFTLNGKTYALAVNNGPNHLHGGIVGYSYRVWTVEELTGQKAVLTLESPDGEEGYPGALSLRVTYALEGASLSLHYQALAQGDTVCNLTNHSYFNLSGQGSGPVLDQLLSLCASRYTPADETSIPYGTLDPVAGTPMDLRAPTPIGAHIADDFEQLKLGHGYDHNYVVDGPVGTLRPAARAFSPKSGIVMDMETTLPGVQLYTANFLEEGCLGKGGASYGPRHAFCLETQFFPDSPNQPAFPSTVLRDGARYDHTTRFTFSVE